MVTKKELQVYYRKISRHLACFKKCRESCMDDFSAQLEEYVHNSPQTTIEDIYNIFGAPQIVANNYMEQLLTQDVISYKRYSLLCRLFGVVLIVALLVLIYPELIKMRNVQTITTPPESITNMTDINSSEIPFYDPTQKGQTS